jgi:ABC-2 type transport system ATP-binding protein
LPRYNRLVSEYAIEARGLRKAYGETEALRGVDLHVRSGEVFCLLGPNGAGKTTAVEIMEGHRAADSGEVRVLGHDPARAERALRERVGIVLQQAGVERFLTVEEVLELYRGYYPHPRPLAEVLEMVGLTEKRKSLVRRLSSGQMRRLDVAVALAGDPDLLFLDEPTTGFDPAARRGAWEMIRALRGLGKTVFLTTHYLEEAEALSDRAAIIVAGKIRAEGTVAALRSQHAGTVISFRQPPDGWQAPASLRDTLQVRDGTVVVETLKPTRDLYDLTREASERGVELAELSVAPRRLEDIYLELAGEEGAE